jgi:hypothetical protein
MTVKKGRKITPMAPSPTVKKRPMPFENYDKAELEQVPVERFLADFDIWQARGDLLKAGFYVDERDHPFPRIGEFDSKEGLTQVWADIDRALADAGFDPEGPTATKVALIVANAYGRLVEGRDQKGDAGKASGYARRFTAQERRLDLLAYILEERSKGNAPSNKACQMYLETLKYKPSIPTVSEDRKAIGHPARTRRKKVDAVGRKKAR